MTKEAKKKTSAIAAAIEILKAAGEPMHVKAITEKVLADYDTGLKGKTPVATIGAKLHLAAKKGETFVKTAPGTFGLRDAASTSEPEPTPDQEPEPASEPASAAVTPNATVVRQGRGPQAKPDPKPARKTAPRGRKTSRRKAPAAA